MGEHHGLHEGAWTIKALATLHELRAVSNGLFYPIKKLDECRLGR